MRNILILLLIAFVSFAQESSFKAHVVIEEVSLNNKIKFDYNFNDLQSLKDFNVDNLIVKKTDKETKSYHIFIDAKTSNNPKESNISLSSLNITFDKFEEMFKTLKNQVVIAVERIQ